MLLKMIMAASTNSSCSVSVDVSDNIGFDSDLDSATEESELEQENGGVAAVKCPTSANIARPRKTKTNDPPCGKPRPCRGALSSDPKGVTSSQCIKEFQN